MKVINQMLGYGFGFVEVGTITPQPQSGNQKPRVFRLAEDEAIINHLGFNNKGSEKILNNLKLFYDYYDSSGVVGVNIGKNKSTKNSSLYFSFSCTFFIFGLRNLSNH